MTRQQIGLILGVVAALAIGLAPAPVGMSPAAQGAAAVTALMAIWWISEAIPIPITALLPLVLFPGLGVLSASSTAAAYGNHLIFLFLGGFLLAIAVEKWRLHFRIALHTVRLVGTRPRTVVLGFMLATAFLSMWISNTAAAMLMVTIAMAVVHRVLGGDPSPGAVHNSSFATGLMLAIAYGASAGGIATLIGSPPNAIFAGVVEKTFGQPVSFVTWLKIGLPFSAVLIVWIWLYLTRIAFPPEMDQLPGGAQLFRQQLTELGPMSREEKSVAVVFGLVASAWIARGFVPWLPEVKDSTIAMFGAVVLFALPSSTRGQRLLDWPSAAKLPWDVLLLFGGGFALAESFIQTGLSGFIADQFAGLGGMGLFAVVVIIASVVIFLTEVTSNTATASLLLPLMAALSLTLDVHPYALMLTVAIGASLAFMLPVATPPNAIVFGSRCVTIAQMAKDGLAINIACIVLLSVYLTWIVPGLLGVSFEAFPAQW